MISALYVAKNEEQFIDLSLRHILPFVEEVVFVDNGCTDKTVEKALAIGGEKIKLFHYPSEDRVDMGAIRTFSVKQATEPWVMLIDCDEIYPVESMKAIRDAIENPGQAISFRVPYLNLAWRAGYVQDKFEHYPDRIYRRDVVDELKGMLPNDMWHVLPEFYKHRPILEYDNAGDLSFENPVQPILRNAPYHHLARTRGYNFEFTKWVKYNKNLHPRALVDQIEEQTRINQWVSGLYPMRQEAIPDDIPLRNIINPKVSVIIPNFQYANFVGEAIQSCLDQTYPVLEIIVVDDGSHDNSIEVINQYVHKDPRVKLLSRTNMGVATARNGGIANSLGDFFICLDADDKLDPTYVEKTVGRALSTNADVVYSDLRFFGDQEGDWTAPDPTVENMRQWQIVPSTCALVERHCFDACGGFNPTVVYEDWDFWCNLMIKQGFKFAHFTEPLFLYRKHGPSRINELDKQQAHGFWELAQAYGVTRKPDLK